MTKQLLFCFVRDKHVNGRSARAKDSLWGSIRQTHGQQNVQCHIHSEGERRLHPDSQMGWRNGARKPFPRHRALKTVFRPSPLCKDSTDRPGKETGLTDNAFSSHINQENVFYICICFIQSPLCAHFTLGYVPSFFVFCYFRCCETRECLNDEMLIWRRFVLNHIHLVTSEVTVRTIYRHNLTAELFNLFF